jgi:hypothetical protein
MRRIGRRIALACAVAIAVPAAIGPAPRAAGYLAPYPYRIKEFDVVQSGDTFHFFYIRQSLKEPFDSTTVDLGHATTTNFLAWQEHDSILHVRPDNWDNLHIWAPTIVRRGDVWYLLYGAVTNQPGVYAYHQRIGLAWSTDLFNWNRFDQPVWECADVPWSYCDPSTPAGGEFRDPMVMPDPTEPGRWLMYYAARRPTDPGQMVIGVARSNSAFPTFDWTDLGPMWNTGLIHTGSELVESPEMFEHDGLWYLFYTTNAAQPIAFQTASSPLADSASWSPQMRLHNEVPDSDGWFGIELFSSYGHDYIAAANSVSRGLTVREIVWDTPPHFHTIEPTVTLPPAGVAPTAPDAIGFERIAGGRLGSVRFRITLPDAMRATLDVLDVQGRRVRSVLDTTLPAGVTEIAWDGAADGARRAPSGVYLARLSTAAGVRVVRVALAR